MRGPRGSEPNGIAEGFSSSAKETANTWAPVWNVSSLTQEQQNSAIELPIDKHEVAETKPPTPETPVILIRSAEECDEVEKSSSLNLNQSSNGRPIDNGAQLDPKPKSPLKSKPRKSEVAGVSPSHSGPLPYKNAKKPKPTVQKESKSDTQRPRGDEKESKDNEPVKKKNMKLGTEVTAKVYQIRAHGLVLDLGGGLRGMYRFEVGVISIF